MCDFRCTTLHQFAINLKQATVPKGSHLHLHYHFANDKINSLIYNIMTNINKPVAENIMILVALLLIYDNFNEILSKIRSFL